MAVNHENTALIRRWIDIINERRLDEFFDVWSEDFVIHAGPGVGEARNMEELQQLIATLLSAVPDAQLEIKSLAPDGDLVHGHFVSRGSHQGEFMGVPATGKGIEMWTMGVFRISGGKIAEEWVIDDYTSVLAQLDGRPVKSIRLAAGSATSGARAGGP